MVQRIKRQPGDSPADIGNDVSIRFSKKKIKKANLYDEYVNAGLSPEEADEMCNLMEQET